jgi:ABC-type multidrug transport system fused ATPase/permease subunit
VMLITESLVLLGIVTLLVYIEPMGAIFVAVTLGTVGAMIHMVTKTRILQWGKARQLHEGLRLQHLQQGLGGVKDVKLLGREEEFLAQYHVHNLGSAAVGRRQNIMQALPLLWFELLGVFSLATLMITMIIEGKPVAVCVSALSVFAVAAFRIMPAMNRIVMSVQNLRYSLPVTNILYSEVHQLETSSTNREHKIPMPFKRELELFNVGYTYPSASGIAIEAINLIINKGSSVAFVGESGAGKSTLVDLILGLLTPDQGSIRIDGVNIHSNIRAWQEQIGYVPQTIYLSDDSICRNIAFGVPSSQIDVAAVNRALKAAQLDEFIASLPDGLNTLVGERGVRLSGGQCQRIGIARALYHNPSVLVLDEATSALDLATEAGVMEAVYALKGDRTLIIIAHRLSTVQQCDRVISMDHGKLIEEQVLDLRAKQATDNTKSEWKEHA